MKKQLFVLTVMIGLVFVSCKKDDPVVETCDTSNITYTNTVGTILNTNCATSACHVDGNEATTFFSLEGFAKASVAAGFGRMVGAINHSDGFAAMPIGADKLEQCDIDKLTAWIDGGTPE